MAEPKSEPPSTKERLATIVQGFDTFDSEMKTGTRQRREKDEFKISELKTEAPTLSLLPVAVDLGSGWCEGVLLSMVHLFSRSTTPFVARCVRAVTSIFSAVHICKCPVFLSCYIISPHVYMIRPPLLHQSIRLPLLVPTIIFLLFIPVSHSIPCIDTTTRYVPPLHACIQCIIRAKISQALPYASPRCVCKR